VHAEGAEIGKSFDPTYVCVHRFLEHQRADVGGHKQ
jgi:hypothetical protein